MESGGLYGTIAYCIKNDGSIKWKCQLDSGWTYSMASGIASKVKGNVLTIEIDHDDPAGFKYKSVLINTETGIIIRYIPV